MLAVYRLGAIALCAYMGVAQLWLTQSYREMAATLLFGFLMYLFGSQAEEQYQLKLGAQSPASVE